ncbi:Auxin response factor 4 [Acorus gramineus]|uniref:Auxin response factor 4 n=1 Tax=Acorus gramineus TaxID=55184 RepID=A0AAV9B1U2_ACOGR|nr:Auxin response factor 4 [Acorus gramineus]
MEKEPLPPPQPRPLVHSFRKTLTGYKLAEERRHFLQSGWSVFMSSKRLVARDAFIFLKTSPSEFIVPFDRYMESLKNYNSIGMRFKMRFEGEEAPEQRYREIGLLFTGPIVGIGDVRWDETSSILRPERVSLWKIELALTPPVTNSLPISPTPDSSVLTREGT